MSSKPLKIAIVVGEHSGDVLGASFIQSFKKRYPNTEFFGIAGPKMQTLGADSLYPMDELAVMGLVEILGRLPRLIKIRKQLIKQIIDAKPDLFLGIDAPEFNTGLELKLKQHGIKTVHYVSPSVWAWRQKRIFKIKKATDRVLALLPFEKAFYDKYQVKCDFVGHPLADEIPLLIDKEQAKQALSLDTNKPVLTIMPGSRGSELGLLCQPFMEAAALVLTHFPDIQLLVPMVDEKRKLQFEEHVNGLSFTLPLKVTVGNARACLMASDAALMASGTATLEAMLCKAPMTIGYRVHPVTFAIGKRLVSITHVGLPNLLNDTPIVSEFLQNDMTPEVLANDLVRLLNGANKGLIDKFTELHQLIRRDASERACDAVLDVINE